MRGSHARGSDHALAPVVVVALLALSGSGCVAFALTHQQHFPQPALMPPDAIGSPHDPIGSAAGSLPDHGHPYAGRAAAAVGVPQHEAAPALATPRAVAAPAAPATRPAAPARATGPAGSPLSPVGAGRPVASSAPVQAPPGPTSAVAPVMLDIPTLRVHAGVIQLGLTAAGTLEVPAPGPHYNDAGWYRYSPAPGSIGPAVIAGHVDSAARGPSVFYRLGSLRAHDAVTVTRADGSVAVFAVDAVLRFPKSRFPTALVYGNTDRAALRLITCGGSFDRASGHYVDNIVVLASLLRVTS